MTRLFLLRHGEVEENYQRHFGGRIDMNLSPNGHQQAVALAGFLRDEKLDSIYASPMKRVQQTLAPLLGNGMPQPHILQDLREIDFGDWTGKVWKDALLRHGLESHQWLEALVSGRVTNAESIPAFISRVAGCLDQILASQTDRTVAVYCHGGVIRGMLSHALNIPFTATGSFAVDYASVTELEVHDGRRFLLKLLNFLPWRNVS